MKYSFAAEIAKTDKGYVISVPFNVWEVAQQRDEIKAEIIIEGFTVPSMLIPMEKGKYEMSFERVEGLDLSK